MFNLWIGFPPVSRCTRLISMWRSVQVLVASQCFSRYSGFIGYSGSLMISWYASGTLDYSDYSSVFSRVLRFSHDIRVLWFSRDTLICIEYSWLFRLLLFLRLPLFFPWYSGLHWVLLFFPRYFYCLHQLKWPPWNRWNILTVALLGTQCC